MMQRAIILATSATMLSLGGLSQGSAQVAIVQVPPPPPKIEAVPVVPLSGYVWRAGYWRWQEGRYVWVPGAYVLPPQPRAVWVPGHWTSAGGGWVWVAGYWGR